jgi:hypothetical protein
MSGFLDSICSICRMAGARSSTKDSADRGHSCFPKRSKRTVRRANANLDAVNQESQCAASDRFAPRYVRGDGARAHVEHERERYAENRNNQHGLPKTSGAESFRDHG